MGQLRREYAHSLLRPILEITGGLALRTFPLCRGRWAVLPSVPSLLIGHEKTSEMLMYVCSTVWRSEQEFSQGASVFGCCTPIDTSMRSALCWTFAFLNSRCIPSMLVRRNGTMAFCSNSRSSPTSPGRCDRKREERCVIDRESPSLRTFV